MSGSGSVFRRCGCVDENGKQLGRKCPDLTRSGHGSWAYRIDLGPGPDDSGKHRARRQKYKGGYATKKEAAAALAQITAAIGNGSHVDSGKLTVGQYLEQWLAGKVAIRPSTLLTYRMHVDAYLTPHLGHLRLDALRAADIERLYASIRAGNEKRAKDHRRPVGPTTLRRIHATLSSALNSAVKKRLLPYNPAAHVELPAATRPRVSPWEPAQLGAFLDSTAVQADRLGTLFLVMAFTGLRRGEAIGLRWIDIDLEAGVLHVRQQLTEVNGVLSFGKPKTKSGEDRRVELDGTSIGALLEHRLHQDAERTRLGDVWVESGLVFTQEDGSPLRPEWVTKRFAALTKAAGLPHKRLHDLRHGAASLMILAGTPLPMVSKMIGHSTYSITVDTYSHMVEGAGRTAADAAVALVPRAPHTSIAPPAGASVHMSCTHGLPAEWTVDAASGETAGEKASDGAPPSGLEPETLRLTAPCGTCQSVSPEVGSA